VFKDIGRPELRKRVLEVLDRLSTDSEKLVKENW